MDVYEPHPDFVLPDSSALIWRYMDFTKLCSMLDSRALFFSSVENLEDAFEGSYPSTNDDFQYRSDLSDERKRQAMESFQAFRKIAKQFRKTMFVNCWHVNNHESAAMWKLYLKSDEGVAIQSSVARLTDCFRLTPQRILV